MTALSFIRRRSTPALLALALVLLLGVVVGVSSALALVPGRAYEMVSPLYKGGYAANTILATSPDGETVVYSSFGAFAGEPQSNGSAVNFYLARRTAGGWSTAPVMPPASIEPQGAPDLDFSPDLGLVLSKAEIGTSAGEADQASSEQQFITHSTGAPDTAEDWSLVGTAITGRKGSFHEAPITYETSSSDFAHVLINTAFPLSPEVASRGVDSLKELYELPSSAGGTTVPRLVGVMNTLGGHGEPEPIDIHCSAALGSPVHRPTSRLNAVAAAGEAVFFTANANRAAGEHCDATNPETVPSNPAIVYVRFGGERTLRISPPGPTAVFEGADESGTTAFFTMGEVLYMASLGCAGEATCAPAQREVLSVTPVSQSVHADEAAGVQGVVAMTPDASHAYFLARGVLEEATGPGGLAPRAGADNLYLLERDARYPAGHIAFVADLCSGPGLTGEVEDSRCPLGVGEPADATLWSIAGVSEAQVNECPQASPGCEAGRFLVFASYGRLSADDTNQAKDVYRYDAQAAQLVRVSVGEAGYGANGNAGSADATIRSHGGNASLISQGADGSRAVTEDGSRIVFTTARRLSENAASGPVNAYEWHADAGAGEGGVTLVSSGSTVVENVVISPSGRDVLFTTEQGLVPQDTDGQLDIYDARLGGGFAPAAGEPPQCVGEACQGPLTNPPPLLVPGSVSQGPGENLAAPVSVVVKAASKPKSKPTVCRKGYVRKGGRCVRKKASKTSRGRGYGR